MAYGPFNWTRPPHNPGDGDLTVILVWVVLLTAIAAPTEEET